MCRALEVGTLKPRLISGDCRLASLRPLKQTLQFQIKQATRWVALDSWLSGRTQRPFTWAGAPLLPFPGLPAGPGPVWARRRSYGPGTWLQQKPWGGGPCVGGAALLRVWCKNVGPIPAVSRQGLGIRQPLRAGS